MTDKQLKATQLQFLEDMKDFNYPKWVNEKSRQYSLNLNFMGVTHVAKGLTDLTKGYAGEPVSLLFLREIMAESLVAACCNADVINMQAIPIYADFIYNIVPVDLRINK